MSNPKRPTLEQVEAMWKRPANLIRAQLCVSIDDDAKRATSAAQSFFNEAWLKLSHPFRDEILGLPPSELHGEVRAMKHIPGAMSAMLGIETDAKNASRPYSAEAWSEFIANLGQQPRLAWFDIITNGAEGWSNGPGLSVHCRRVDNGGSWLLMQVVGERVLVEKERQEQFVSFLEGVADFCNPVYGEISWKWEFDSSVLELALNTSPDNTLPNARNVLRGYAWVTILPEEIGHRLMSSISSTGTFSRIKHLSAGGYLVQACEDLADYDESAAERVCAALRPVLPPGRPDFWNVHAPNILADMDPGDPGCD